MAAITIESLRALFHHAGIDLADQELQALSPVYQLWRERLDLRLYTSGVDETEEVPAIFPSHQVWSQ